MTRTAYSYLVAVCVVFFAESVTAVQVSGVLDSGTWSRADSPVYVADICTLSVGDTLTIESGVDVVCAPEVRIRIRGVLRAEGASGDSISFMAEPGMTWDGIALSGGDSSVLRFVRISGCDRDAGGVGGGMTISGTGTRVLLEDCVFSGNRADVGGGVYIQGRAVATIVRSSFVNNSATTGGGLGIAGAQARVTRCVFRYNSADIGGGGVDVLPDAQAYLYDCVIDSNTSRGSAGGLWIESAPLDPHPAFASLVGCTVQGNTADEGAGVLVYGAAEFDNCMITGNVAQTGGGMWVGGAAEVTLGNSEIRSNHAENGKGGGILANSTSQTFLNTCSISDNTAEAGGGMWIGDRAAVSVDSSSVTGNQVAAGGGGFHVFAGSLRVTGSHILRNEAFYGGGLYSSDGAGTELSRCVMARNTAEQGGGIYTEKSATTHLVNCTAFGNTATYGGGLYLFFGAAVDVVNTIFWNDTPDEIYCHPSVPGEITVAYSCVQGGCTTGEHVLDDDPVFEDPAGDDFRLSEGSPCIDAGDPAAEPDPDGTALDVGAFHYPQESGISYLTPQELALLPAVPNPFNAVTILRVHLPSAGNADLTVYSTTGQCVRRLFSGYRAAGTHMVSWAACDDNGRPVGSGLYIGVLRFADGGTGSVRTTRMILVR